MSLEELSRDDVDLLRQAFVRLMAEGVVSDSYSFGELLDIVLARGYETSTDYIYSEILNEEDAE